MSALPFPSDHPMHPSNQPEPRATKILRTMNESGLSSMIGAGIRGVLNRRNTRDEDAPVATRSPARPRGRVRRPLRAVSGRRY